MQRKQTVAAACKAIYLLPVLCQGFLLLWIGVYHFNTVCTGIFLLLKDLVALRPPSEPELLLLPCFIVAAALLLCCNFVLAKISLNKKTDELDILYKIIYIAFSVCMIWITRMNSSLIYGFSDPDKQLFFYNNGLVITYSIAGYVVILLLHFFYKKKNKLLDYFQLTFRIVFTYIFLAFLLSLLVFLVYRLMKLIG
ncbi:hypothetical protein [Ferruginibacter sp.]